MAGKKATTKVPTGKPPALSTAEKAHAAAMKKLAKRNDAAAAKQRALEAQNAPDPVGTKPTEVQIPTPRDSPAQRESSVQPRNTDAKHPTGDQPEGQAPSWTVKRMTVLKELVPTPLYTAEELATLPALHDVIEQAAVLEGCVASLSSDNVTAAELLTGSVYLHACLVDTLPYIINEKNSKVIELLISPKGSALHAPLKWTSAAHQNSLELLTSLQYAASGDVTRLKARREGLLSEVAATTKSSKAEKGKKLSLPLKNQATALTREAPEDEDAPVVDLTQSDQLAAMAYRGRRASALGWGTADDEVGRCHSPAGSDGAGERRGRSPAGGNALGRSRAAEDRLGDARLAAAADGSPAAGGRRGRSAPAAATGTHPPSARAAGTAAAGGAGGGCPAGDRRRPSADDGPAAGYGARPWVDRGAISALAAVLGRSLGAAGTGAHDADPTDAFDQELTGKSVLEQMRRKVPQLESCLPLYMQLEREKQREALAAICKTKPLKFATHPLDLNLFQQASAGYSTRYLAYSTRAAEEHAAYVRRLAQHWASISNITLLKYDQAVRECAYLSTLTFAEATETQELWLRIVMPDILRHAAARLQTGGGLSDRSGLKGEGVLGTCGFFQHSRCPHVEAQSHIDATERSLCQYGEHECDTCFGSSSYAKTCQKCWDVKRPARQQQRNMTYQRPQGQQPQQQRQQQQQLRPQAPGYTPQAPGYPQGGQLQLGANQAAGGYVDGRNVKPRRGPPGGRT